MNHIGVCCHAELDVARKFFNMYIRKKRFITKYDKKRKFNNYILWVVRISNPKNKLFTSRLTGSKPCHECIKHLKLLGFSKIGYSDNNGNIIVENMNKIKSNHLSDAQKFTQKFRKKF